VTLIVAFIKRVGKDKCKNRMNWVKEYSEVFEEVEHC